MGDNINACSSSSSAHHHDYNPPCSSDEISHFLRQILVRSSSSSSPSPAISRGDPHGQQCLWLPPSLSPSIVANPGISAFDLPDHVRSGTGAGYGTSGACFSENVLGNAALVSSSSVGVSENDTDEYDCESEEGLEALIDDPPAKPAPPRSSSKRSRAAEVHNLSEKRRRSRINEKMKALQNLIPNSNKTDKASMLDEAIEYLKKLQLQVQMLSMRNGLSLHPMCLPGVLQPMQISQTRTSFGEENGSLHMNMTSTLHVNQDSSAQTVFNLPNQCTFSNRVSVPDMSDIINSETSFGMELPIQRQFGLFRLLSSSEEICREDILPHHQLNVGNSKTNPSEFEVGVMAMVSSPLDTASDLKESSPLDACVAGRDQSDSMLLKNKERNLILPPQLTGFFSRIQRGSAPSDDIKLERPDF